MTDGFEIIDDRDGVAVLAYAGELIGTIKIVRASSTGRFFEARGFETATELTEIHSVRRSFMPSLLNVDEKVERLLSEA